MKCPRPFSLNVTSLCERWGRPSYIIEARESLLPNGNCNKDRIVVIS